MSKDKFDFKMSFGRALNGDAQLIARVGGMGGAVPIGTISDRDFSAIELAEAIVLAWNNRPAPPAASEDSP